MSSINSTTKSTVQAEGWSLQQQVSSCMALSGLHPVKGGWGGENIGKGKASDDADYVGRIVGIIP